MVDEIKKKIGVGIGVILLRDGKILLGLRNSDPVKADSALHGEGTWTMPGGKLEFGNSFEDGAKREVIEETGIILNDVKVICVNEDTRGDAHFVTIGLLSEDFSGDPKTLEPDEIIDWKWFKIDKIPKNIYFPSKKVLNNYLQNKFYIKQ